MMAAPPMGGSGALTTLATSRSSTLAPSDAGDDGTADLLRVDGLAVGLEDDALVGGLDEARRR